MDSKVINRLEHVALRCELDLKSFCEKFTKMLTLPLMAFDYENATEWGEVSHENVQYNISRPYIAETLTEWDSTIPGGCNFGISFGIETEHVFADNEEWIFENIIQKISKQLAAEFDTVVYYHRSHILKTMKNIERKNSFFPESNKR